MSEQYKIFGHTYFVTEEKTRDGTTIFHSLVLPDGSEIHPDFSFSVSIPKYIMKKYIELGYPKRISNRPLSIQDIQLMEMK